MAAYASKALASTALPARHQLDKKAAAAVALASKARAEMHASLQAGAKIPGALDKGATSIGAAARNNNATAAGSNATHQHAEKSKCDKLDSTPAKRACREREAYLLFGCPATRGDAMHYAPSRTLPLPTPRGAPNGRPAPLWVVRPSPTVVAGAAVTFELGAGGLGLRMRRDYLLVSCEGPTIVLCDDYSQASPAAAAAAAAAPALAAAGLPAAPAAPAATRLLVTCRIRDAGVYTVRAAHVFSGECHGIPTCARDSHPRLFSPTA